MYIPVILGTTRQGRESEKVANFLIEKLKGAGIETELIDTRNFNFSEDYGPNLKEKYPEYKASVEKADALIIVAPEYNHSYPGTLKSLLDILYEEYKGKKVGLAAVSGGGFGGIRMISSFLPIAHAFGMDIVKELNISKVQDGLDSYSEKADEFIKALS